ncbi:hypothetical protein EXIGLDRAFT_721742, partial [Exidia glandulosa HHB12029]
MSSRFGCPTRVAALDYCSRSQSGETTFAVLALRTARPRHGVAMSSPAHCRYDGEVFP